MVWVSDFIVHTPSLSIWTAPASQPQEYCILGDFLRLSYFLPRHGSRRRGLSCYGRVQQLNLMHQNIVLPELWRACCWLLLLSVEGKNLQRSQLYWKLCIFIFFTSSEISKHKLDYDKETTLLPPLSSPLELQDSWCFGTFGIHSGIFKL